MDNQQNPWESQSSQGHPHSNRPQEHTQPQSQHSYQSPQAHQDYQPPRQEYQTSNQWQQPGQEGWASSNPAENPWESIPPQSHTTHYDPPPMPPRNQGIRRSDTDTLLESEPDRAEQVEHMQQYEASKPQSEDDMNQATLQKQFPSIDSSLIAAIYNDHKQSSGRANLAEVREMLQELV